MKKIFIIFITLSLVGFSFSCERKQEKSNAAKKLKILTTFLPIYVFTLNVAKDVPNVEVDVLAPAVQGCPHDYEPSPSEMKKVEDADALVANGLKIESFLEGIKTAYPKLKIVEASDGVEFLPDAPKSRMWENRSGALSGEMNPHVWVSPFVAAREVKNIGEALANIDPPNADKYRANAAAYSAKLEALGAEAKAALANVANKKIVTVHNAFDYFARDLGLEVIAVLRLDPEAEPTPGDLARIIERIRTEKPAAIFVEPQYSTKIADVISKETGTPIYQLDPVVTGTASADLYEIVMRKNIETLKTALATGGVK